MNEIEQNHRFGEYKVTVDPNPTSRWAVGSIRVSVIDEGSGDTVTLFLTPWTAKALADALVLAAREVASWGQRDRGGRSPDSLD